MRKLDVALYAEGDTDHLFLPPVIQRSVEIIMNAKGCKEVEIPEKIRSILFEKKGLGQEECIQEAARRAARADLLVVHCDADAPTSVKALQERYDPGYKLVQQTSEKICKSLIPIIPIRMTEAWMLAAEYELFKRTLLASVNAYELGLVSKVKQVESDPNPKQTLKQIAQKARAHLPRRHREIDYRQIYIDFGLYISLERLSHVPSYKQFVDDLTTALRSLQVIP